jgi:predicted nuclease of predicted toxin-antitoxin system
MTLPPELGRIKFRVFLDAGVPDSVGIALANRGHEVIRHRDVLPEKTPDPVVAATALANDAVLVAIDHDMTQLAQRYGVKSPTDRFARLNLILICCNEVLASKRLEHAISLIEHEWELSQQKASRRMWIEIGPHYIRTNR